MEKQINGIDAPKLRIILISSILLLFVIASVAFWFFRSQLLTFAEQVQKDNTAASISTSDISKLESIQDELEENEVAVTRAQSIVADSQQFQYQDQIIADITAYAQRAGVVITGYTFPSSDGQQTTASNGAPTTAAPAPAGLKSVQVSIAIKNPVEYKPIMQFVKYIEANLTKMQITEMTLAASTVGSSQVNVGTINVQVYTR
jgi:hypothetical protein